jgi:uncharacterized protein YceK
MIKLLTPLLVLTLLTGCGSPSEAPEADTVVEKTEPRPLASIQKASITLPDDTETFGEGAHADVLNRTCLACHSVSMVRYQPPLSRKQWTATVDKMREAYGAPIEAGETAAIVDALMATAHSKP